MMEMSEPPIVLGTGPVGLVAALALAMQGARVTLVGPSPNMADRRTTALMLPSLHFLTGLGLDATTISDGADLAVMRIVDGSRRLVRAPAVTFRASEIGETRFGYNLPNAELLRLLAEAVESNPLIEWHRGLAEGIETSADFAAIRSDDGRRLTTPLIIAADGRHSRARQAAGIMTKATSLPQAALVVNIAHDVPHQGISTEFHTEHGPFTQVPLAGRRSSIVWVVSPRQGEELRLLADEALAARIEERMQSMLGRLQIEGDRQVYPLASVLPSRFARNRVALVGEAAHVFPPIGAQGLNLGLRDVKDLVGTIAGAADPGADHLLFRYDAMRRRDVFVRAGAVNALNRSLLSAFLPAQIARSAGLAALASLAPLRGLMMREGLNPGSGWAALREQFLPRAGTFSKERRRSA